jgi:hypothetical protein
LARLSSTLRPWSFGALLGAAAGLPVLGVGGRMAMRLLAIASHAPPSFSPSGTMTVLLAGLASGVAGGLLYATLCRFVTRPRWVRSALFAAALVLLTLRGLHPVQPLAFNLFMPLALAYGAIVDAAYSAWYRRRVGGGVAPGAVPL